MIMICLIIIFNNNEANAEDGLNLKLNDKCEDLPYSFLENQNEASAITDKFIKSLVEKNGISVDDSEYTVNGMRANAYPLYYAGAYINTDGNLVLQISEDYYKEDYKDCEWYTEFTNIVNSENFYCHNITRTDACHYRTNLKKMSFSRHCFSTIIAKKSQHVNKGIPKNSIFAEK